MTHARRASGGFTLFEFAVCTAVTALLGGTLLCSLGAYQRECEEAAVRGVLASLRTALAVEAARAAGSRGQAALAGLTQENPMSWLAQAPSGYLGEYERPRPEELRRGSWYFDRTDRSINFLRKSDTFSSRTSNLLKFKVELLREPVPTPSGGRREATHGLILVQAAGLDSSANH